jgi:S-formylglutathione hydrolase FrmB
LKQKIVTALVTAITSATLTGTAAYGAISPNVPTFRVGSASYTVVSADNGHGTSQLLRVLTPTDPKPGMPHNFLYVLPVESGTGSSYGDGMDTLRALDAQDRYNLTIIEPTFEVESWYADGTDPKLRYETFMTKDLVPWVTKNLSTSGHEQNWLIGFSKSGLGVQDLLFKHPRSSRLAPRGTSLPT